MPERPEDLVAGKQRPFNGAEYLESLRAGRSKCYVVVFTMACAGSYGRLKSRTLFVLLPKAVTVLRGSTSNRQRFSNRELVI